MVEFVNDVNNKDEAIKYRDWETVTLPTKNTKGEDKSVRVNEYFRDNQDMMLGNVSAGGLYSEDGFDLSPNKDTQLGSR